MGYTTSCGCMSSRHTFGERNRKYNIFEHIDNYYKMWDVRHVDYALIDEDVKDRVEEKGYWSKNDSGYWVNVVTRTRLHNFILNRKSFEEGKVCDHINRRRNDNRKENFRIVTIEENNKNRSIRCDNTSGKQGVTYDKSRNKWIAQINNKNKRTFERFNTYDEAVAQRIIWEREFGFIG